jgi:hypothetical protein
MTFLLDEASNGVWEAKYPARIHPGRPDAGGLRLETLAAMGAGANGAGRACSALWSEI